ncbi:MAG: hypothetical protein ACO2ZL_01070, partial [Flavobacteriales bacterium]
DGFGDASNSTSACSQPAGYVANNTDNCDDASACNYAAAGNPSCTYGSTWYADVDGDGAGDAGTSVTACSQPANYVATATDCDDSDNSVTTLTWYGDSDGDGLGDPSVTQTACSQPAGYVDNSNDEDPQLNSSAYTGTILYPGDVYFSYAQDYRGVSEAYLGFTVLKNVAEGTLIAFTPNLGWNGSLWEKETSGQTDLSVVMVWTAPAGGIVAGTEVILFDIYAAGAAGAIGYAYCNTASSPIVRAGDNLSLTGGEPCGTFIHLTSNREEFCWDKNFMWLFQPDDNWDYSSTAFDAAGDSKCRHLHCIGINVAGSGNSTNTGNGTLIAGTDWGGSMDARYSFESSSFSNATNWVYNGGAAPSAFVQQGAALTTIGLQDAVTFKATNGNVPYNIVGSQSAIAADPNGSIVLQVALNWDNLANGMGIVNPSGQADLDIIISNSASLVIDAPDEVACHDINVAEGVFQACDGNARSVSVSGNIALGANGTYNGGQGNLRMSGFSPQSIDANNYDDASSTKCRIKNLKVLNNKAVTVKGHVKMKPGGSLEFDDTAMNESVVVSSAVSSSITFESSAAGTAAIAACVPSNFGDGSNQQFTFERYIPADPNSPSWVNIGAYVTGTTVADWTAANPSMLIFKYNESNYGSQSAGWSYLWDASTELLPGSGYMAMLPQGQDAHISVTGAFQMGDVPITLTFTDDPNQSNVTVDGWNLVSNPYPAPVNMQQVLAGTGISTWYVFDNQTADAYIAGGSDAPSVLDVGQSMWIKVSAETVITFSEEDKVTDNTGTFVREFTEEYAGTVGMQVSNASDNLARAFVKFQANTSAAFDMEHDALMYNSTGVADLGVWMVAESGEKLSRQAAGLIGEVSTIPLKVNSGAGGLTSFHAYNHPETPDYTCVVIEDTETGERAQLGVDTLSVDLPANTHFADRFLLHFTPAPSMTWQSTACDGLEVELTGEAWETWDATWTANDGSTGGTGFPNELEDGDYTFEFTLVEAGCLQSVAVTVETACLGDFNLNGERDIVDLLVILAGLPGGTLATDFAEEADCDCDGAVTVNDMLTFLTVFATPCE